MANDKITVQECVEVAGKSPLTMGGLKDFDQTLHFLFQERGDEWLKASLAGHLARSFIYMLMAAQKAGVSAAEINAALEVELDRNKKAIEGYTPPTTSQNTAGIGKPAPGYKIGADWGVRESDTE